MDSMDDSTRQRVNELVDAYRARCLWFLREDFYPSDTESALRALGYIRRYGDAEGFKKAGELSRWLLPHSKNPSAVS